MPNIRKKGKKFVGAWIPEKMHAAYRRRAVSEGQPVSTIIENLLAEAAGSDAWLVNDAPLNSSATAAVDPREKVVKAIKNYGKIGRGSK